MDFEKIKKEAEVAVTGNRLLIFVVILIIGAITSTGIGVLLTPILLAGFYFFTRELLKTKKLDFNQFVNPFNDINYIIKVFVVGLITYLYIFVGLILFVVPGIIFALRYSQVFRILGDNRDLSIEEVLKKSQEMMRGHKSELFSFILSFILHWLLFFITCGLYGIYFLPYFEVAMTNYYLHLTGQDKVKVLGL